MYSQGKDFKAVRDVLRNIVTSTPKPLRKARRPFEADGKGNCRSGRTLTRWAPGRFSRQAQLGTARANVIAEAIIRAPANASVAQVKLLVRAKLERAGFDPDRPWLAQGSKADQLNGGDFDVARNSAPNGGAAPGLPFDDTAPQTPVRANPQAPPPGQGNQGGNGGTSGGAGGGRNGSGGTGESSADSQTWRLQDRTPKR